MALFSPRGMHAPRAICFACVDFFLFYLFLNDHLSKAISGSTKPIFTIFSPYGRYLIVNYRSDPLFPIAEGTLPWQPILGLK